jgi:hypothetical protein
LPAPVLNILDTVDYQRAHGCFIVIAFISCWIYTNLEYLSKICKF